MVGWFDRQVEEVEDVMDAVNEGIQMADEMGEAMAQQIGPVMDEVSLLGWV